MPRGVRDVNLEPLKRAALQKHSEGLTWAAMARNVGWYMTFHGKYRLGDGQRVRRELGLKIEHHSKNRKSYYRETVRYEFALVLCKAIEVDPVDVGL